ncbi:MAG: ATP-binding protein [Patescibacteria group bacterium]|nr:ATP-binding protein [Patescibacteria group bacterium]
MKLLPRIYENLEKYLKPNKVLIIFGPRQVGKTTLLESFLNNTKLKYRLGSGDNIKLQQIFSSQDFDQILGYAKGYELVVIDEAQKIPNIGIGLKILVDQQPGIKVVVTGSSSFELSGQVGEPLTGRKTSLTLFPVSQMELLAIHNRQELKEKLAEWLVFGSYPEVITSEKKEKPIILADIAEAYLLKDILELESVKGSKILLDLLRLLAFQVGNEVSLTELSQNLGIDYKTVARYLDLFEKSFILLNIRGYSGNLRSEVTKKSKYYFYDNGVRNAIISNFNDLELRDDVGKLWENFLVVERLKYQHYKNLFSNNYFWRTWEQQEIDWVEEREGKLFGYEFKYSRTKAKNPKLFLETYKNAALSTINKDNYLDFVS